MAWYDDPLGSITKSLNDYFIDPIMGREEEEEEAEDEVGQSEADPFAVDAAGLPVQPIPRQPAPQAPQNLPMAPIPGAGGPLFNPGAQQGVNAAANRANWRRPGQVTGRGPQAGLDARTQRHQAGLEARKQRHKQALGGRGMRAI